MVPPTAGWALLQQLTIKKVYQRQGHKPIWPRQLFSWGSFSPGAVRLTAHANYDSKWIYDKLLQQLVDKAALQMAVVWLLHHWVLSKDTWTSYLAMWGTRVWIRLQGRKLGHYNVLDRQTYSGRQRIFHKYSNPMFFRRKKKALKRQENRA